VIPIEVGTVLSKILPEDLAIEGIEKLLRITKEVYPYTDEATLKSILSYSCGQTVRIRSGVVGMTGRSKDTSKAEDLIEVIYRDGVFRPLEAVELEEGKKLKIRVDRFNIKNLC